MEPNILPKVSIFINFVLSNHLLLQVYQYCTLRNNLFLLYILDIYYIYFISCFYFIGIPSEWTKEWESISLNKELYLPSANNFIPTDFRVLSIPREIESKLASSSPIYPKKIVQDRKGELWFKQDFKFKLPRAYCCVYFYFDELRLSARKYDYIF